MGVFQSRAVAVGGNGASAGGAGSSAFEQNCVSKEEQLTEVLKRSMPGITYVSVQDISGGCGAMFEVSSYWANMVTCSLRSTATSALATPWAVILLKGKLCDFEVFIENLGLIDLWAFAKIYLFKSGNHEKQ